MKAFIARDNFDERMTIGIKKGVLYLFSHRPKLETIDGVKVWCCFDDGCNQMELDRNLFPEVTFENSPQEVEIKLMKKI